MTTGTAISLVLGLAAAADSAVGQSFTLVGYPSDSGGRSSRVYGLSDDGGSAAGYSRIGVGRVSAFTWSSSTGRVDWGLASGMPRDTQSYGISGDGSTSVGLGTFGNRGYQAMRYRQGVYQGLGTLSGSQASVAVDASYDGSVVVGRAEAIGGGLGRAFRWTEQGGMQDLGRIDPGGDFQVEAHAVSRDGTIVVGESWGFHTHAFIWTVARGMRELEAIAGTNDAKAYCMSGDCAVIAGSSAGRAVVWEQERLRVLDSPAGWIGTTAYGVSDDGSVIVGTESNLGAVVWTRERGGETLAAYLAFNGLTLPDGFRPIYCTSVSADGRTIAGWGAFAGGGSEGFVATIPSPGPIAFAVGGVLLVHRRTRRTVGS